MGVLAGANARLGATILRANATLGLQPWLRPHNDELQRTSDGNAAGSPLNSVFDGPEAG
jgi:hypothetical protein